MLDKMKRMTIDDGHGVLFGMSGQDEAGTNIHQYGILALDAIKNNDLDAFQTITITESCSNPYETVRQCAKNVGLMLSENEFEWMDDRLQVAN